MDRTTALSKIRKLLNLSASPNEHEAAAALRQARALMSQFDISQDELELADITVQQMACKNAVKYDPMEWNLLSLVAEVFHVRVIKLRGDKAKRRGASWLLFGRPSRTEIVVYFYTTLLRLLTLKRRAFLRSLAGTSYSRSQKSKLVTAFWIGWLSGVRANLSIMAMPETEAALIERLVSQVVEGGIRTPSKGKAISFSDLDGRDVDTAFTHGKSSGEQVSLHHGVKGQDSGPNAALIAPPLRLAQ